MGTQGTFAALGTPIGAALPTEQHDAVTEVGAFFRGENGAELPFHLLRLFSLGQTQATADANAVGVTDHTAGYGVQIAQQQIGGLATHTGEPE